MTKPRILLWDLETGFNLVTVFSLWTGDRGISHDAIQQEKYIISASFKWLGEKEITAISLIDFKATWDKDPTDDRLLVKAIREKLLEADVIVHHYGDSFDIKSFNSRCVFHGFKPVNPLIQIDTYKIAKKHFFFNSNKLDYLGKFLGFGGKIKTRAGLWLDCMKGDEDAITDMVRYNKQDVRLLEQVYLKLRPYTVAKANMGLFVEDQSELVCPTCGSSHIHQRGYRYTSTGRQLRFQCQEDGCGAWSHARVSDKIKPKLK